MFANLLKQLVRPDPGPLRQMDTRHALSALLVRAARSDGNLDRAEEAIILDIIKHRYGLDVSATQTLYAQARELEAQAPDTVRFTRAIKAGVPYEERAAVLEALWRVVLADDTRSAEESALLRMTAGLLGISDVDSNMARKRAAAR